MHDTPLDDEARPAAERDRLAREVHDAVSQTLFAASLVAGTLARDPLLPGVAREQARTIERLNHGALAELRMLRFEFEPDALRNARLADLLRHVAAALAARDAFLVASRIDDVEPPPPLHVPVYRIAQEALANVVRHSGARHVHLAWTHRAPRRGRLVVADDGQGFDSAQALSMRAGLHKMRGHAAALGAELEIRSAPAAGTRIEVEIGWS